MTSEFGGFVWFVAGVLVPVAVMNGGMLPRLGFIVYALGQVVAFLGMLGTGILLGVTAITFEMLSRAGRAQFDMKSRLTGCDRGPTAVAVSDAWVSRDDSTSTRTREEARRRLSTGQTPVTVDDLWRYKD